MGYGSDVALRRSLHAVVGLAETPSRFSVFAIAYFLAVLGVDRLCALPEQLLLGALTWACSCGRASRSPANGAPR